VANCLDVGSCAVTVFANCGVLHHVTLLALQVLHLVRDKSSIRHVKKSLLDIEFVDLMATSWILTNPLPSNDVILVNTGRIRLINKVLVIDEVFSANINI
jgi:hypothetical protein